MSRSVVGIFSLKSTSPYPPYWEHTSLWSSNHINCLVRNFRWYFLIVTEANPSWLTCSVAKIIKISILSYNIGEKEWCLLPYSIQYRDLFKIQTFYSIKVHKISQTPPVCAWPTHSKLFLCTSRTKRTPDRSSCLQPLFFAAVGF